MATHDLRGWAGVKNSFRGYYRPDEAEFQELWAEAEIVLDANVLLNFYRYSIETRNDLLDLLGQLASRLWLPHQAALEYQRNRIEVMTAERDAYDQVLRAVEDSRKAVLEAFRQRSRHVLLNFQEAESVAARSFDSIEAYIKEKRSAHPDLPEDCAPGERDEVRDRLTELFDGRVGEPFAADELQRVFAEGAKRYENQTPPGYMDAGKDDDRRFGDLVIWKQVLAHASSTKKPVILVTDERKEDWWLISRGQVVLPRPELVEEATSVAGVPFYMYRSSTFMSQAKRYVQSGVSDAAVQEVQAVADRHEAVRRHLTARARELEHEGAVLRRRVSVGEAKMHEARRRDEKLRHEEDRLRLEVERAGAELVQGRSMLSELEPLLEHAPDGQQAGLAGLRVEIREALDTATQRVDELRMRQAEVRHRRAKGEDAPLDGLSVRRLDRSRARLAAVEQELAELRDMIDKG